MQFAHRLYILLIIEKGGILDPGYIQKIKGIKVTRQGILRGSESNSETTCIRAIKRVYLQYLRNG